MAHSPNPDYPNEKLHPPKPIENPQIPHPEDCQYFSFGILMDNSGFSENDKWRGTCGECTCAGYPQVECRLCGAIVDEVIEFPTGPDDKRNDAERIITQHVCD